MASGVIAAAAARSMALAVALATIVTMALPAGATTPSSNSKTAAPKPARTAVADSRPVDSTPGAEPDPSTKERVAACVACHGDQGRAARDGFYPRIAGKPAGYLYNQLVNFREGRRRYAPMTYLVDHMTDDYLREIAEYFSRLDPPYAPSPPPRASPDMLERGKELVRSGDVVKNLPACVECHGAQMTGAAPNVPGLIGLPIDYVNAQLGAWRAGSRKAAEPDCMEEIAKRLSLADIAAAAGWLALQPVPADHAPIAMSSLKPSIECGSMKPGGKSAGAQ